MTGDLWIADVGQATWEEINVAPSSPGGAGRGANFGWSAFEGHVVFNDWLTVDDHHAPFFVYDHSGGACSISGGVRARGELAGSLKGWYVFGDYCAGTLWALEVVGARAAISAGRLHVLDVGEIPGLSAVAEGPDGTLFVLGWDAIYRLADR